MKRSIGAFFRRFLVSMRSGTARASCWLRTPVSTRPALQSPQAEAAEATQLLDLAEDGFDDGFAHLVNRSSRIGAQFVLHGVLGRGLVRRWSALRRHGLIVLHATGGDMQVDTRYPFIRRVGLTPVARIGTDRIRLAPQVSFELLQHRQELTTIVGLLRDLGRHGSPAL